VKSSGTLQLQDLGRRGCPISLGRKSRFSDAFIARFNELTSRRAVEQGFDQWFPDAYERMDAVGYDERRATLRQVTIQVTQRKRDHDPRYAINRIFDR
jgi:hypothetical protein